MCYMYIFKKKEKKGVNYQFQDIFCRNSKSRHLIAMKRQSEHGKDKGHPGYKMVDLCFAVHSQTKRPLPLCFIICDQLVDSATDSSILASVKI